MPTSAIDSETSWSNFRNYVVDEVAVGAAIDFHPRPFILNTVLLCLAYGDTAGLRRILRGGVPLVTMPYEYRWITQHAERVLQHWQKIEDAHGDGVMLDAEVLLEAPSLCHYGYDQAVLDKATSYQARVGRVRYLKDLHFEF
jgi:hypothetical protein